MAVHPNELPERKSREEYTALLESDPAHRAEAYQNTSLMDEEE